MPQEILYWHKVEAFIGREKVLQDILAKLQDNTLHLVEISGGYGYGKTRLLLEILKRARQVRRRDNQQVAIPTGVIDLYKTEYHSAEGLAQAIVESLPGEDVYFSTYFSRKKERDEARLAGNVQEVKKSNQAMLEACKQGLLEISKNHSLLLMLDTVERWVYPSLEGSLSTQNVAPAVEWFKDVCSSLSRGLILLAGRDDIKRIGYEGSESIALAAFSSEETRKYVRKVAQKCQRELKRPFDYSKQEIETLQQLSEGRPIFLALYLERIAHGDEKVRESAAHAPKKEFESMLIRHLMQDPQIKNVLRVVGRALRGVDFELLEEMSKAPGEELGESDREELRQGFEILQGMSFAKRFHGSPRTFLHDEMYEILARNVYQSGDAQEADQAAMGLYRYYKKHTEALNQEIGALYTRYAETESNAEKKKLWAKIESVTRELQTLDTDFVFYRWQRMAKRGEDPIEMGLRRYYRLAHEAATSSDWESLLLLRFELIRIIKNLQEKSSHPWLPFLQGLLFVQDVWERNALGNRKETVDDIDGRFLPALVAIPGLSSEHRTILTGLLKVWRGIALLYAREADYVAAKNEFETCIEQLKQINEHTTLHWFQSTILALAHRQNAYLYKRQGLFETAINDYRLAAYANRDLDFNFEEATIRNDLGDTQIMTGALDDASLNLPDAFDLRRKMKNGARLALSYSTLSRYMFAKGDFDEAQKFAHYGMNLSMRSTALARISWAEAARRYAIESFSGSAEAKMKLLDRAEQELKHALNGLTEPIRSIDMKVELGCLYRDRLRYETDEEKRRRNFTEANRLLLEVKEQALKQNPPIVWRVADAMANRIWLGLFAHDEDFTLQAGKEFEQLPIFDFDIKKNGAFRDNAERLAKTENRMLLQFIGKYQIGLGAFALGKDKKPRPEKIDLIARHWMLGLEYTVQFAPNFRGLDAARKTIHRNIKTFNRTELIQLSQSVLRAERAEGIDNSYLQQLMRNNAFWIES